MLNRKLRPWSMMSLIVLGLATLLTPSLGYATKKSSLKARAQAEKELFTTSKKGLVPWTPPSANENCLVTTTARYKSGEVKKETFSLRAKNKADCEWSRKTFSENFDPARVKKVEARMTWRGQ